MKKNIERDLDILDGCEGLYVGQLQDLERDAFARLVVSGHAWRDYDHAAGLLGLAKVRLGYEREKSLDWQ